MRAFEHASPLVHWAAGWMREAAALAAYIARFGGVRLKRTHEADAMSVTASRALLCCGNSLSQAPSFYGNRRRLFGRRERFSPSKMHHRAPSLGPEYALPRSQLPEFWGRLPIHELETIFGYFSVRKVLAAETRVRWMAPILSSDHAKLRSFGVWSRPRKVYVCAGAV